MRTHRIVVPPPAFDDNLCLLERVEDFSVEQFTAGFGIEDFAVTVLRGTAGYDVGRLGTHHSNPFPPRLVDKFGAIVGTNMHRDAAQDEEIDDVGRLQFSFDPDGNAFACERVEQISANVKRLSRTCVQTGSLTASQIR